MNITKKHIVRSGASSPRAFFGAHAWYWYIPLAITTLIVLYALWAVSTSGLLPTLYSVAASVLVLVVLALCGFLWLKRFKNDTGRLVARSGAGVLMAVVIVVSLLGAYMLQSGLSTLDKLSTKNAVTVETNKPFNIFISGIDTYGDIATQSRSDVNIAATVDPVNHKVLLTTLPRDSYVRIALGGNDEYDKLTHAGNYGVESSMKTVARVLDTPIDAYVRINFSTFIGSIDTLGGITVDNPVAFTIDGESFPVGQLELNGKQALLFSRERHSLKGGDVDRGKNQQRVIQGIIDKITSIRSIDGYNALLGLIGDSVQTNISGDTMKRLINDQVSHPQRWTTDSYSVGGKGQTGGLRSYAMPNAQLYMYVLDETSLATAQGQIRAIMK